MAKKENIIKEEKNVQEVRELNLENTEVMNSDPSVIIPTSKDEAMAEVTSPENIENIESELKEEHKEEIKEQIDVINESTPEPESIEEKFEELSEIAETYGDADKRLEKIVNENSEANLAEALQKELKDVDAVEKKLEQNIQNIEKNLTQKERNMVSRAVNSKLTTLWSGIRYT